MITVKRWQFYLWAAWLVLTIVGGVFSLIDWSIDDHRIDTLREAVIATLLLGSFLYGLIRSYTITKQEEK